MTNRRLLTTRAITTTSNRSPGELAVFVRHRTAALWITALLLCGTTACDPTTQRPLFPPLPQALVDTIGALPNVVISDLAARLESEGLQMRRVSPRDGFLETRGYDAVSRTPRDVDIRDPNRVFRIRIWADSLPGGRSFIRAEATFRRTSDPSETERQTEVMAGPEHAGQQLVLDILQAAKARFNGQ